MTTPENWRLIETEVLEDPFMNIAIEEAIPLAKSTGLVKENTLRLWRNDNAVVIGRFQSLEAEVNSEFCNSHGVKVVRRFTGGGAVYHDIGNLNYALSVGDSHPKVPKDILESYAFLCNGIILGLKSRFGIEASFKPLNDVAIGEAKISGTAQSRVGSVVFHHGTLLTHSNLSILAQALNVPKEKLADKGVTSVRKRVTTLEEVLGRKVTIQEAKEAMVAGFEELFGTKLKPGRLTSEEEALARHLYETKYNTREWNNQR